MFCTGQCIRCAYSDGCMEKNKPYVGIYIDNRIVDFFKISSDYETFASYYRPLYICIFAGP